MPPIRTPLGHISQNRQPYAQLSPTQRAEIVGASKVGATPAQCARTFGVDKETARLTILKAKLRVDHESIPKKARKKSYSDHEERRIVRHCRLFPKDTYADVIRACNVSCKKTTIKKILKEHGMANWRAKRRPELTEAHALKRLAWCLAHRGWNWEEWGMVVWSDECSVERGRGKQSEWVFRTPAQKWDRDKVQTYSTNKSLKVMVWGAFWDLGRSELYIMDRDFASLKGGYSAGSYLEVLEAEVGPIFEDLEPGYQFMQDNASIHTAGKVKDWFTEQAIELVENWPPYSPDLNPIEHIWWALKVRVFEMFPDVAASTSKSEYARQRLESCLQAAWATLDKELFDNLYQSMEARIEAVIKAKGWHTKY